MKERPIITGSAEVRLILAGRKTQTRRLMKPQPAHSCRYAMSGNGAHALHLSDVPGHEIVPVHARTSSHKLPCSYGVVGDRLWVREPFRYEGWDMDGSVQVTYGADGDHARIRNVEFGGNDFDVWVERRCDRLRRAGAIENDDGDRIVMPDGFRAPLTPSIHMPRWASRITLTITDVRAQRLQDITADDAVAEGARRFDGLPDPHPYGQGPRWSMGSPQSTTECLGTARMAFANHFGVAWDANPWVWAVSFEVAK